MNVRILISVIPLLLPIQISMAEPLLILKGTAIEGAFVELFNIDADKFGSARVAGCAGCKKTIMSITPETRIVVDGEPRAPQSMSLYGKFVTVFFDEKSNTVLKILANTPNQPRNWKEY